MWRASRLLPVPGRPVHQQRDGGVNPVRFDLPLALGHTDEFTDECRLVLLQHDGGLVSGPGLEPLDKWKAAFGIDRERARGVHACRTELMISLLKELSKARGSARFALSLELICQECRVVPYTIYIEA